MGLDNIWIAPKGKSLKPVTRSRLYSLRLEMLTNPADSFRGKSYAWYVAGAAHVDLYEDLDNATVLKVAAGP